MKEIALSKDINRIEAEIQMYKEKAGESIWEIGRRLNHVKEKDLAHGQFIDWVENQGIEYREANRMMKVAKELDLNMTTLSHLGTSALYLIATLPEEERNQEQRTADGDYKTPDEMTVRELQDLKRQLKQAQAEADAYKSQHKLRGDNLEVAHKKIDELEGKLKNKEPEVIEKIVEVEKEVQHPHIDDLRSDNQQLSAALKQAQTEADALKQRNKFIEQEYSQLIEQRKEVDEKSRKYDELTEGLQELEGKMNDTQKMLASHKKVMDTIRHGNELLDTLSGLIYATDIETLDGNELVSIELNKLVRRVEWWLNDINKKMDNATILEGEIVYD